jgi:sulfur carrier protein
MIQPGKIMKIKINGDTRDVPAGLSVAALLTHLGMNTGRVAVERNLDVLPRARWADTQVAADDSYEIVQLVGGGK